MWGIERFYYKRRNLEPCTEGVYNEDKFWWNKNKSCWRKNKSWWHKNRRRWQIGFFPNAVAAITESSQKGSFRAGYLWVSGTLASYHFCILPLLYTSTIFNWQKWIFSIVGSTSVTLALLPSYYLFWSLQLQLRWIKPFSLSKLECWNRNVPQNYVLCVALLNHALMFSKSLDIKLN